MNTTKLSKFTMTAGYFYILFPFLIFVLGWIRPIIAIPVSVIMILSFVLMVKDTLPEWIPCFHQASKIKLLFLVLAIVFLVILSGIGGYVYQNFDHACRNTIFRILVEYRWPVVEIFPQGSSALTYYIGFWLPAALFGKLFGLSAGYFFQSLWAVIGIMILISLLFSWRKKMDFPALVIVCFFSGLDAIPYYLQLIWHHIMKHESVTQPLTELLFTSHIEWWADYFQFSSILTQLFFVFNQALPVWIIIMLLLLQQNRKNSILLLGLSMLSSTLPFIGLIPIVLVTLFDRPKNQDNRLHYQYNKEQFQANLHDLFTVQNILGGGCAGILSFLYLKNNASGQAIGSVSTPPVPDMLTQGASIIQPIAKPLFDNRFLAYYILFLLIEIGIYAVYLFRANKRNLLYWCVLAFLCIAPLVRVGQQGDFGMRATIPGLFVLMLLLIEQLSKEKNRIVKLIMILFLCVGAITPLHEMARTIVNTSKPFEFRIEAGTTGILSPEGNNFSSKGTDNLFFNYLAK